MAKKLLMRTALKRLAAKSVRITIKMAANPAAGYPTATSQTSEFVTKKTGSEKLLLKIC